MQWATSASRKAKWSKTTWWRVLDPIKTKLPKRTCRLAKVMSRACSWSTKTRSSWRWKPKKTKQNSLKLSTPIIGQIRVNKVNMVTEVILGLTDLAMIRCKRHFVTALVCQVYVISSTMHSAIMLNAMYLVLTLGVTRSVKMSVCSKQAPGQQVSNWLISLTQTNLALTLREAVDLKVRWKSSVALALYLILRCVQVVILKSVTLVIYFLRILLRAS